VDSTGFPLFLEPQQALAAGDASSISVRADLHQPRIDERVEQVGVHGFGEVAVYVG